MPVEVFTAEKRNSDFLRVYSLRMSYEFCRYLDKSRSIASGLASHCLILRQKQVPNKTDFGYREELKTGLLKKMNFVYLQKIQNLMLFLYAQIQHLKSSGSAQRSHGELKNSPLFGMILIENIEDYFGDYFDHKSMGTQFMVFLKLLKTLEDEMPFNTNIYLTLGFWKDKVNFDDLITYFKSEQITCWKVGEKDLEKNGYSYSSDLTRKVYEIYQSEPLHDEEEDDFPQIIQANRDHRGLEKREAPPVKINYRMM